MEHILTVTQLTANIKMLLETGFGVLWVTGEISNLRRPGSGHVYFTLKDGESQIRAVVFRRSMDAIGFGMEDGLSILCRGRISVYAARGEYQLVVDAAEPKGIGALQIAFEQLKRRLEAEGLFARIHKKPLPLFPARIGVVTSPTGAAIKDFLNITKRRYPSGNILIAPARVQGMEAAAEIAHAIDLLNRTPDVDVIVVTRGGGTLEDLYPFNDERVARAIFCSRIPVVSAVGHEIDFTISDFVADLRAPTPSAAAEIVVPERRELAAQVEQLCARMAHCHYVWRNRCRERIAFLGDRVADPRRAIGDLRIALDDKLQRLVYGFRKSVEGRKIGLHDLDGSLRRMTPQTMICERRNRIEGWIKQIVFHCRLSHERARRRLEQSLSVLQTVNPLAVLSRGYSITRRLPGGDVVKEAASLAEGAVVSVQVRSGIFHAAVMTICEEKGNGGKEI